MTILTDKDLSMIRNFIRNANRTNKSVKMTKRIDCGVLWSIDVRFMSIRSREIPLKEANEIYDQIEFLSKGRVVPNRNIRDLQNGILELRVSYINRTCGSGLIIQALEFISADMLKKLTSLPRY